MKNPLLCFLLLFPALIFLSGCHDPAWEANFGCKAAAAYGNYDSAVRLITRAAEKPKVREMFKENPAAAANSRSMRMIKLFFRVIR